MPVLASFFLRKPAAERDSRIIDVTRRGYAPVLARTMRHPGITIFIATMMLGSALAVGSRLGAEFLPRLEEGALTVTTTKLPGISLEAAIATQTMVEKTLKNSPRLRPLLRLGAARRSRPTRWGSSKATPSSFSSRNRSGARPRPRLG
jgi:heavy metal efflux system protein